MKITVISSGSGGNCTVAETTAGEKILFDAGIRYAKIVKAAGYVDYAIITHEHGDHAYRTTPLRLLENGTEVYMTCGTQDELRLPARHNLHTFRMRYYPLQFKVGSCRLKVLPAIHDAAEPIVFQVSDSEDRVLYATDTWMIPEWEGADNVFTKLVVEANHFERVLSESSVDAWHKARVGRNHLSIERLQKYLVQLDKTALKEVHLIHISKRNGDGEKFRMMISDIVKVPVFAH